MHVKKKKYGRKKLKKSKNTRLTNFARERNEKEPKKGFHTHFFFTQKKNTELCSAYHINIIVDEGVNTKPPSGINNYYVEPLLK